MKGSANAHTHRMLDQALGLFYKLCNINWNIIQYRTPLLFKRAVYVHTDSHSYCKGRIVSSLIAGAPQQQKQTATTRNKLSFQQEIHTL